MGDTLEVNIDTCKQDNSNDGSALETSLSTRDFVIFLESSSEARLIIATSKSSSFSSPDSVQVVSQQCSKNQTSETVVSEDRTTSREEHLSVEQSSSNPAQSTFIAAPNTAYYIIYETVEDCGSGVVTIEAPVQ
eukprot:scaffold295706_cov19-Tisochrysis_lutea.AAC.1